MKAGHDSSYAPDAWISQGGVEKWQQWLPSTAAYALVGSRVGAQLFQPVFSSSGCTLTPPPQKVYVVGGGGQTCGSPTCNTMYWLNLHQLDAGWGSMGTIANMPNRLYATSVVAGGKFFIIGGVIAGSSTVTTEVWQTGAGSAAWAVSAIQPLQQGRFGAVAMVNGANIIVCGGAIATTGAPVPNCIQASTSGGSWLNVGSVASWFSLGMVLTTGVPSPQSYMTVSSDLLTVRLFRPDTGNGDVFTTTNYASSWNPVINSNMRIHNGGLSPGAMSGAQILFEKVGSQGEVCYYIMGGWQSGSFMGDASSVLRQNSSWFCSDYDSVNSMQNSFGAPPTPIPPVLAGTCPPSSSSGDWYLGNRCQQSCDGGLRVNGGYFLATAEYMNAAQPTTCGMFSCPPLSTVAQSSPLPPNTNYGSGTGSCSVTNWLVSHPNFNQGNCLATLGGCPNSCAPAPNGGFGVTGNSLLTCTNGAFTAEPVASPLPCSPSSLNSAVASAGGAPVTPLGGNCSTSTSSPSGTVCSLNCVSGWTCQNCGLVKCNLGAWSVPAQGSQLPDCQQSCNVPPISGSNPGNCRSTLSGHGESCTLEPSTGYRINNSASATITCVNGNFPATLPTFEPITCDTALLNPPGGNGTFGTCTGVLALGATCQLGCKAGWTRQLGTGAQRCDSYNRIVPDADGGAGPAALSCRRDCAMPILTQGLQMGACANFSSLPGNGSSCLLSLQTGYQIKNDGSLTLTCTDGVRSPLPIVGGADCNPNDLAPMLTGPNVGLGACPAPGNAMMPHGQNCTLGCTANATFNNPVRATCDKGVWLVPQMPMCRMSCSMPADSMRNDGCLGPISGWYAQCTIALNPGWEIGGQQTFTNTATLMCNDGGWANTPSIVPSVCPLSALANPTSTASTRGDCASAGGARAPYSAVTLAG
jgi:hypothetical protein